MFFLSSVRMPWHQSGMMTTSITLKAMKLHLLLLPYQEAQLHIYVLIIDRNIATVKTYNQ